MGATRVAFAKCDSKSEIEFFFERAELGCGSATCA